MNANELYPIVKPAIIVGICGQTGLVTSFIEHATACTVFLDAFPPSWIFVDMHDTSQLGSRNSIFLRNNDQYSPITAQPLSVSGFQHGLKRFQTIFDCW